MERHKDLIFFQTLGSIDLFKSNGLSLLNNLGTVSYTRKNWDGEENTCIDQFGNLVMDKKGFLAVGDIVILCSDHKVRLLSFDFS